MTLQCKPKWDIHQILRFSAAGAAIVGLAVNTNVFTVAVVYCMTMYAFAPTVVLHDVAGLMLAGWVLSSCDSVVSICLFVAAYACFAAAVVEQWLRLAKTTNHPPAVPPKVNVDDI